jgi:restriction endonuclease S subunit
VSNALVALLGEIATLQAGFGFPPSLQGRTNGQYPFAKVGDISRGGRSESSILSRADHYVDAADVAALRAKIVPPGSILFAKIGEAIRQNHRVVSGCEMLIDNNAMAAIPNARVASRFLYHYLKTVDFYCLAPATTVPALRKSDLEKLQVPLPPLPEQSRIAAILDQADALRAKRREALAQLDSLTQSIFIEMFGDPARNTLNLPLASLSVLGSWQSGGTPPRGKDHYFDGEIPWFSSGELESMYAERSAEHISAVAVRETSVKLVPEGSLMLGMYDTAALKASIAAVDCACNQAIAFSLLDADRAEVRYVYYAIVIGREHFRRLQRGVRQKNLNLSMIRDIKIPAPPIAHQRVFAVRVQAVESLKAIHRSALTELDTLFASLQHRAFAGQLS